MREYFPGHWLRPHIDRTDELVISATIAVAKLPLNKGESVSDGPDGNNCPTLKTIHNISGMDSVHTPSALVISATIAVAKLPLNMGEDVTQTHTHTHTNTHKHKHKHKHREYVAVDSA
jgi:hypothetical protein